MNNIVKKFKNQTSINDSDNIHNFKRKKEKSKIINRFITL